MKDRDGGEEARLVVWMGPKVASCGRADVIE